MGITMIKELLRIIFWVRKYGKPQSNPEKENRKKQRNKTSPFSFCFFIPNFIWLLPYNHHHHHLLSGLEFILFDPIMNGPIFEMEQMKKKEKSYRLGKIIDLSM